MLGEHMWKVDLSLSSAAPPPALAVPTSVPGAGFSLLDLLNEILREIMGDECLKFSDYLALRETC